MIYLTNTEKTDLLLLLHRDIKELQNKLDGLPEDSSNIYINDLKHSLPININRYKDIIDKINGK